MRDFLEVIIDLWKFACEVIHTRKNKISHSEPSGKKCDVDGQFGCEINTQPSILVEKAVTSFKKAHVCRDKVNCYKQPAVIFDTKIGEFSYGDEVYVYHIEDSFIRVKNDGLDGWVETRDLVFESNKVFPVFYLGRIYDFDNEETKKIRSFIHDELLGGKLHYCLQPVEFILYILKREKARVHWPQTRPRNPGSWQGILRGLPGVSIGIEPRTSSMLERINDDKVSGFLGYVQAVHPDQSITLESVGRVKEGEYRIEHFSHSEWREWRPVFISLV